MQARPNAMNKIGTQFTRFDQRVWIETLGER